MKRISPLLVAAALSLTGCAVNVVKSQTIYVTPADDDGPITINQDGVWTSETQAEQFLEGEASLDLDTPLP